MAHGAWEVYDSHVDGLGVIALVVGLSVALSSPTRGAGRRDIPVEVWAWILVAAAALLILAAALAPPTPR